MHEMSALTIKGRRKGFDFVWSNRQEQFFYAKNSHSAFTTLFPDLPNLIRDSRFSRTTSPFACAFWPDAASQTVCGWVGVSEGKGLLNVNTLNRWAIVPFYTRLRFSIFYAIRYEFWLGHFSGYMMGIRVGNTRGVTDEDWRKS